MTAALRAGCPSCGESSEARFYRWILSLDALRQASDTSYYKGQDSLWVKLVSSGDAGNGAPGGGTNIQVSR